MKLGKHREREIEELERARLRRLPLDAGLHHSAQHNAVHTDNGLHLHPRGEE
jgi:hypothetical protein